MSPAGDGGITPVENDVIFARLDALQFTLAQVLDEQRHTNGRLLDCEKWQAAMDPVVESMQERVSINSDKTDNHQTYIDQQKGGTLMRLQLLSALVTVFGILALVIKMLLFHN